MGLIAAALVALTAASPTPTPTAPNPILMSRPEGEQQPVRGQGLSEVAKAIKLRLPPDQGHVLTNESVKKLAEGVELTTAKSAAGTAGAAPGSGASDARKLRWQQQYVAALTRVAMLEASVKRLEAEANRLAREFYAHDDPAQRDGVIKPAWDKALADLKRAQAELEQAHAAVDDVVTAARQDGAEPGWFRGLEAGAQPAAGAQAAEGAQVAPTPKPTARPTPFVPRQKPPILHN
jgi:hypothetical protein